MNNYNIINTLTTGKSSSLVLNNLGKIVVVKIGEESSAIINNSGSIGTITAGKILDKKDNKGMDITNTGYICDIHTGENSENEINTEEGHIDWLETGLHNGTKVSGANKITKSDGNGETYYKLFYLDDSCLFGPMIAWVDSKDTKELNRLIKKGWSYSLPKGSTVKKVIVLNDSDGIFNKQIQDFGHDALMLIMDDGSGVYYSYMASGGTSDFLDFAANQKHEGFLGAYKLKPYEVKQFFDSDYEKSGEITNRKNIMLKDKESGKLFPATTGEDQTYDRYITIDVTPDQGKHMLNYARAIYNDRYDSYQLYTHNCVQVAEQILKAGNIGFGSSTPYSNAPNPAFRFGMAKAIFNGWEIGNISKNPLHLY
jgi:hypothetical protein